MRDETENYIYAKCPSKPLINEPKRNSTWVKKNMKLVHALPDGNDRQ
jgi:hypothetical protein